MQLTRRVFAVLILVAFATTALCAQSTGTKNLPGVLTRDEAGAIFPATVFFRGQSATIQPRNSAGVRTVSGKLMLAALVDTSGYSSNVAQTYQAYILTEVPLQFGSRTLPPGAYGFGFIEGGRMVVMDIGGNRLLEATTSLDEKLARPTPLQIIAEGSTYHLYLGRNYASFTVVEK